MLALDNRATGSPADVDWRDLGVKTKHGLRKIPIGRVVGGAPPFPEAEAAASSIRRKFPPEICLTVIVMPETAQSTSGKKDPALLGRMRRRQKKTTPAMQELGARADWNFYLSHISNGPRYRTPTKTGDCEKPYALPNANTHVVRHRNDPSP